MRSNRTQYRARSTVEGFTSDPSPCTEPRQDTTLHMCADTADSWTCVRGSRSQMPHPHEHVSLSWLNALQATWLAEAHADIARLEELLVDAESRHGDLGGDPCFVDWRDFRLLRLSSELAWSDWLAHLLTSSRTGFFAHALLAVDSASRSPSDYLSPRHVAGASGFREVSTGRLLPNNGSDLLRRADILIDWPNTARVDIEVKINDPGLSKTFNTARMLEDQFGCTAWPWEHFILLPGSRLSTWQDVVASSSSPRPSVQAISWEQVARALRRSWQRLEQPEPLSWRAWAWAFTGAIEQLILQQRIVSPGAYTSAFHSVTAADALNSMLYTRDSCPSQIGGPPMQEAGVLLNEGLRRLGEAYETIRLIEDKVLATLERILRSLESWAPLTKVSAPTGSWRPTSSERSLGWQVSARYEQRDVQLLFGLELRTQNQDSPMILYARFESPRGNWTSLLHDPSDNRVRRDTTSRPHRYYRELSTVDPVGHLDECVRATVGSLLADLPRILDDNEPKPLTETSEL